MGLTFVFLIIGESTLSFSSLTDDRFNPGIISQVKAPVVADNEIYDNIGELTTPTGAAIINRIDQMEAK